MNKQVDFQVRNNWNNNKAYNLQPEQLPALLKDAVAAGYPVLFYGSLDADMIFEAEQVGLVPAGSIADLTSATEGQEISYEPLPEREITTEVRQTKFGSNLGKGLDYVLVYGISKDKNGDEYLMAKKLCEAGNQTLNLSASFVKLNLVYIMINKQGLPGDIKSKLKL
jgi:bleomycin hydrolase